MVALTELGATVSIASDPSGAAVFIDGQDSGRTTPVAVILKKGSHTLNLRKAGYLQASTKLELAAGQSFQFAPHLSPAGNEDDIKPVGKLEPHTGPSFTKQHGNAPDSGPTRKEPGSSLTSV